MTDRPLTLAGLFRARVQWTMRRSDQLVIAATVLAALVIFCLCGALGYAQVAWDWMRANVFF